jgi:hypothetical protein
MRAKALDLLSCRYGDYQKYPEEPYVGSPVYAPDIYNSWDPNWRGFIGTTLIIAMEEYEHLLSEETKGLVLDSLYNATKGDEYRVGGVDDDNLYPAYSNPVSRCCIDQGIGQNLGFADLLTLVHYESICVRLDWPQTG